MERRQHTKPRRKNQPLTQLDRQRFEQWHAEARKQAPGRRVQVAAFCKEMAVRLCCCTRTIRNELKRGYYAHQLWT